MFCHIFFTFVVLQFSHGLVNPQIGAADTLQKIEVQFTRQHSKNATVQSSLDLVWLFETVHAFVQQMDGHRP